MINIINLILLIIYALIYSIKNYQSIFSMIISFLIIVFLFGKIIIKNNPIYSKKNIILSICLSVIISLFTFNSLTFFNKIDKISMKNISSSPITVEGIYLDEQLVKTNYKYSKKYDLIDDASFVTDYKLYNKLDKSYKMTLYPNKVYDIDVSKVKKIEIHFQRGDQIQNISINNDKYTIDSYLYKESEKANKIYDSSYKYVYTNISNSNTIINIITLLLSIYLYFNIFIKVIDDRKGIITLLSLFIIEFNQVINISNFSKIIFISFILYITNLKLNIKKTHKKCIPLFILSSLYIAFSFIGDRIINNKFSLRILIIYILCVTLVYKLFPYFISFIDYLKSFIKNNNVSKNILKHRIIIFIITLSICLLYHYIFYPYIVHTDSYMEILDVTKNTYSNWHPYFHILMLKAFHTIFGDIKYFLYFRFVIYALLLNFILFYFNKRGLGLKKVYIISILFTVFPITGIMLVTLVKDIDFTLALVAFTFYLFLMIKDPDYFISNRMNYIYMSFSLFLIGILRHNGIYILIVSVILLLFIILKYKKYWGLLSILLSLILVFVVKVPLYKSLNVEASPRNFDIAPLIHGLNYLVVDDKNIDNEVISYLDTYVLSKEKIIEYYDKYNIDLFLHYTQDNIRNKEINKEKIIKMYLKQLMITPVSLIKDRLYGSDMLWNVSEKDGIRFYKYQILYDEFDTNYIELAKISFDYKKTISKFISQILLFISNNEFLNLLFFRTGIYIDLLIILLNYCFIKKDKKWLVSIPILINILTLFIAMAHQEYRYIWMIELVVLLMCFIVIYDKKELKSN